MAEASIVVTTSDYQEGWGAVLNEAMDAGCAIVASHAAGSTPFLIKHGETGMIYEYGNVGQLVNYLEQLLNHPDYARQLGEAASAYIRTVWSPAEAAKRFVEAVEHLNNGKTFSYEDGPMSIAEPIKQKNMYSWCMNR